MISLLSAKLVGHVRAFKICYSKRDSETEWEWESNENFITVYFDRIIRLLSCMDRLWILGIKQVEVEKIYFQLHDPTHKPIHITHLYKVLSNGWAFCSQHILKVTQQRKKMIHVKPHVFYFRMLEFIENTDIVHIFWRRVNGIVRIA